MRSSWICLVMGIVVAVVLGGCQPIPEVDTAVYHATMNELSEEAITTTLPLARMMAQGQTPTTAQVLQTQSKLTTIQTQLDELGKPPGELAAAHTHLTEAITQFQQAYDHLAANLNTGAGTPFDQEFLALAAHGGEAIHQVVAELDRK